ARSATLPARAPTTASAAKARSTRRLVNHALITEVFLPGPGWTLWAGAAMRSSGLFRTAIRHPLDAAGCGVGFKKRVREFRPDRGAATSANRRNARPPAEGAAVPDEPRGDASSLCARS